MVSVPNDSSHVSIAHDVSSPVERDRYVGVRRGRRLRRRSVWGRPRDGRTPRGLGIFRRRWSARRARWRRWRHVFREYVLYSEEERLEHLTGVHGNRDVVLCAYFWYRSRKYIQYIIRRDAPFKKHVFRKASACLGARFEDSSETCASERAADPSRSERRRERENRARKAHAHRSFRRDPQSG